MTTEAGAQTPEVPGDPIDADQAALDAEQTQAPQAATAADIESLRQMIQQQQTTVAAQVQGIQSKVDRGLNAIRQETADEAARRVEQEIVQQRERILNSIEDDQQRESFRLLLENQDAAIKARMPQPQQTTEVTSQAPGVDPMAEQAAWNQVYDYVRQFGLDPTDARINYAPLRDPTLSAEQKQAQFNAGVAAVLKQAAAPPQQTPTPPQPGPQDGTVNPPREAGPAGARANFRTGDDILDAHNANQIDRSQAVEALKRVDPDLLESLGWR